MNPKEKVQYLIERHLTAYDIEPIAIKSALITVEEIMKYPSQLMYDIVWFQFRQTDPDNWADTEPMEPIRMNAFQYWNEVRIELEYLL